MLAEVSITSDQEVKFDRVICAVDCGRVINPDLVRQQIEGGIVFALTGAVKGGVSWSKGLPEQSGLAQLGLARMADAPEIILHIMARDSPPAGVSGAAVPPVSPAIANAVYAAANPHIRRLSSEAHTSELQSLMR